MNVKNLVKWTMKKFITGTCKKSGKVQRFFMRTSNISWFLSREKGTKLCLDLHLSSPQRWIATVIQNPAPLSPLLPPRPLPVELVGCFFLTPRTLLTLENCPLWSLLLQVPLFVFPVWFYMNWVVLFIFKCGGSETQVFPCFIKEKMNFCYLFWEDFLKEKEHLKMKFLLVLLKILVTITRVYFRY